MLFRFSPPGPESVRRAAQGEVVRLGPAAAEDDLGGPAPDARRDPLAGPLDGHPGVGALGESLGGCRDVSGHPDRPPVRIGISSGD